MTFRFENLEIWQESRKFNTKIYSVTKKFPEEEKFGLTNQLRRAAVSVTLNIAEGSDRKSDREFVRFLRMSLTSLEEVVTALYVSLDQSYLTKEKFDDLYKDANYIAIKINALVKKIKK